MFQHAALCMLCICLKKRVHGNIPMLEKLSVTIWIPISPRFRQAHANGDCISLLVYQRYGTVAQFSCLPGSFRGCIRN